MLLRLIIYPLVLTTFLVHPDWAWTFLVYSFPALAFAFAIDRVYRRFRWAVRRSR